MVRVYVVFPSVRLDVVRYWCMSMFYVVLFECLSLFSSFYVYVVLMCLCLFFFFFQAEDGIRDLVRSRGLGDVYKRQVLV